ncbi:hypothetical protein JOB18_025670 [Solea senegalensis]|uniref:Uncharacterized protein n=1 Tax=Solea senegalensis TaxID=28829 RepID=A0AAV6RYX8_SOLSE|nr:hypothetical protein JOB18_025670 [Solea senegalensis]
MFLKLSRGAAERKSLQQPPPELLLIQCSGSDFHKMSEREKEDVRGEDIAGGMRSTDSHRPA